MIPFQTLVESTASEQVYLVTAPIIEDLVLGAFDLPAYQAFLTNAFHRVRHTVPMMMTCEERLPKRLEWMRSALRLYIDQVRGDEKWILNDLAVCGVDPAVIRDRQPNFETELLISYVYDFVNRRNPIGIFGMVHVLLGTNAPISSMAAQLIQDVLGLPDAASYLLSHVKLDREQVAFFEQLINGVDDASDLAAIVHVARRVYRLYGDVIRSIPRIEGDCAA